MSEQPDRWLKMAENVRDLPHAHCTAEICTDESVRWLASFLRSAHAAGRREGIEEAAKVCDAQAFKVTGDGDDDFENGCCETATLLAEQIRALVPSEPKEAT